MPAELGSAGVSQPHPLQQARQGRALRSMGAAEAHLRRAARGIQNAAHLVRAPNPLRLQFSSSERSYVMNAVAQSKGSDTTAIRPFHVNFPEAKLADLRKRINATLWPDKETVADASEGVQLATIQKLARYWGTEYDWRPCEERLNALPNFITEIDGLDIHFIHVRSKYDSALPLIVTHGWPG